MAGTIVHLIITGIVALQPQGGLDKEWRIVVPDLSAHSHTAAIYVARADLVNPPPGTAKLVGFRLSENTATIANVTASGNTTTLPTEILTVDEICQMPVGKCAKLEPAISPAPALDLKVAAAGIASAFWFPDVKWYIDRTKGNPKQWAHGAVAEEICLTFEIQTSTFKLTLDGAAGSRTIELKPTANIVELEISNTIPGISTKHFKDDPHFHLYYDSLLKGHVANDKAKFKNDQTSDGTGYRNPQHKHGLETSLITISDADIVGVARSGSGKLSAKEKYSIHNSNCPPIVDYP